MDSVQNLVPPARGSKGYAIEKYRDLLRQAVIRYGLNSCFLLIGIENQTNVHFAMPVRNMLYDALSYAEQVLKKGKLHREQKDKMSEGELLSGFCKEDKLLPVMTLVVNFGQEPWTAPRSLREMNFTVAEISEKLKISAEEVKEIIQKINCNL